MKLNRLTLLLCVPCLVFVACGTERRPVPEEEGIGGEGGGTTSTRTTDETSDDSDSGPSAGGSVAQECGWEEPDVLGGAGGVDGAGGAPAVWVCYDQDACPAGTYVKWLADQSRSCVACPEGTFSYQHDAESCSEFSEIRCRWDQVAIGSPTADAVCQWRFFEIHPGLDDELLGYVGPIALDSQENVIALLHYESSGEVSLVKYGPSGLLLWKHTAETLNLVVDADDHIYVNPPYECGGVGLTKYDPGGEIVWQRPATEFGSMWLGDEGEIYSQGMGYDESCQEIGPVLKRFDSQGNELFALPLGTEQNFTVQHDGVLVFADSRLTKYALDDGDRLWQVEVSQRILQLSEGVGDSWLVSTADTLSHVSATGRVLWTVPFEVEGVDVALGPDGNWILIGDSRITKISATSGAELWTTTRASKRRYWVLSPEGDVILADESALTRLSFEDGQERWSLSWDDDPAIDSSPSILLQVDQDGGVRTARLGASLLTVVKYNAQGAEEYAWSRSFYDEKFVSVRTQGDLLNWSIGYELCWDTWECGPARAEVFSTWDGKGGRAWQVTRDGHFGSYASMTKDGTLIAVAGGSDYLAELEEIEGPWGNYAAIKKFVYRLVPPTK